MAITECDITRDGVKIEESKRWNQVYRATYRINTDNVMGPLAVQIAARSATPRPVPAKGDSYAVGGEADLGSFALDFQWRRDPESARRWFADVTWRPLDLRDQIPNIIQPDPLLRTAIAWWEYEDTTELVYSAKNITALNHLTPPRPPGTFGLVVNAAGQSFDSLPERPRSRPVLVIQRAYPTLEKVRILHDTYANKLNGTVYRGAAVKTLFVRRIICSPPQWENNVEYFLGQIHIAYDPAGWKFQLVNQGLGYLFAGQLVTFDPDGKTFTEPILLEPAGNYLSPGLEGNTVDYEYADSVSFANIEVIP